MPSPASASALAAKSWEFDARECVRNQCSTCKDGKKLDELMCSDAHTRAADITLKWERYERKPNGVDEFGEPRYKHDFYEQRGTGDVLLAELTSCLATFRPHHDLAKWQDYDWQALKSCFPRGSFVSVQDYSQNINHRVRMEPQSKYYSQVGSTLYMVVLRFHLDDVHHIPEKEKALLHEAFSAAGTPPIIVETHAFVSPDLTHDHHFVQHVNDKYILSYVQSIGRFHTHYARSDGCRAQFKDKEMVKWISSRHDETGVRMDWSFFCSCHGKCDCDGEGGSIKNAADNYERQGDLEGVRVEGKLPDAQRFVDWANNGSPAGSPHGQHAGLANMQHLLPSKIKQGKQNAIYRRVFHMIPATGPNRVSRKVSPAELKLDGHSTRHSFLDVGSSKGGFRWRERSCHRCPSCWEGSAIGEKGTLDHANGLGMCTYLDMCGPTEMKWVSAKPDPKTSLGRALRSGVAVPLNTMIAELAIGQMVIIVIMSMSHGLLVSCWSSRSMQPRVMWLLRRN